MINTTLHIYDVSSMLYAGDAAAKRPDFIGRSGGEGVTAKGLPVGGIRYLLQHVYQTMLSNGHVILVFDSPTDKKKLYADYKSTRNKNPSIYVQQMMALDFAIKTGIPYLKVDTFEADDLIAAVVAKYHKEYREIKMYSGDADLAANIFNSRITLVGTASIYPTVCKDNFELSVKKNQYIPWNTILPFFLIYGKPSNNVPAIATKEENDKLFADFASYAERTQQMEGYLSTQAVAANWLLDALDDGRISEDLAGQLASRMGYVYPKPWGGAFEFTFPSLNDLDLKQLSFFLKIFNLNLLLNAIKDFDTVLNGYTPEMERYLQNYKREYEAGLLSVDNDMTADLSYFTEGPSFSEVFNQEDF